MVRHYAENHAIKNDHDLVFPTDNGQWQSRRNWQRRGFNVACEAAGLTNPVVVDGKAVVVRWQAGSRGEVLVPTISGISSHPC